MPKNYLLPIINFYEINNATNQNGYGVLQKRYYNDQKSLNEAKQKLWLYLLNVMREIIPKERTIKTILIYDVNGETKDKREIFKRTTKEHLINDIEVLRQKEYGSGDSIMVQRCVEIIKLLHNNQLIHPEDFALLSLRFKHHQLAMPYPTKFAQWLCSRKVEKIAIGATNN